MVYPYFDIIENLDAYISLDNLTKDVIRGSSSLGSSITSTDDTIVVDDTDGFPEKYGLLQINDEIITYTEKTQTFLLGVLVDSVASHLTEKE